MQRASLNPTAEQTFELIGEGIYDFHKVLASSRRMEREGDIEGACNHRYKACQALMELLPEDEPVTLEWSHRNSQAALEVIHASAVDHFLIDDFEMSAALLELLLELDGEDHLEASNLLSLNYVAMEEYELFDEVINDISDKHAIREVLLLWSSLRRGGSIPAGELEAFHRRFPHHLAEFIADEHPADEHYLADIESEHPSLEAQARELWLMTENLWRLFPDFITTLKQKAGTARNMQ